MSTHFYIPPEYNLEVIKQRAFQEMGNKPRNYKYWTKKGFKIKRGQYTYVHEGDDAELG
jgi:hypothetical protein